MHTTVLTGIDAVDRTAWDQLTAGHPYAGWTWCKFAETVTQRPTYYALVHDGDTPIGGAIFAVLDVETAPTTKRFVQRALNAFLKRRPLIVSRTAPFTDHRGFFVPGDPAQRAHVLAEIRRVGKTLLREHHGSFFFADYLSTTELAYDWGDFRILRDFTNSGMNLAVTWNSWDGFMADLKQRSKKVHKNVRHNLRYAEEAGISVRIAKSPPPLADVLRLVATKLEHYDAAFEATTVRKLFTGLSALPETHHTWITAHHEGRIVGCELLLHDPATRVCKPTLYGRDYDVEYVYFALSYEDIRYAIEDLRATTVIYDTEAYDFKRRLGMIDDSRNHLALCAGSRFERGMVNLLLRFMDD